MNTAVTYLIDLGFKFALLLFIIATLVRLNILDDRIKKLEARGRK